jgi:hypothetical protein
MSSADITGESQSWFSENQEGATEPSIKPTISIEESLTACLSKWRASFSELVAKVKATPVGDLNRALFIEEAKATNRMITDAVAILDRRNWKELDDEDLTVVKNGRPSKARKEALERKRKEEEEG